MVVEGERPSMPHVPRSVIVTVEASPTEIERVARETLGLRRGDDGALTGSLLDWTDPNARVRVEIEPEDTGRARVSFVIEGAPHVPYFQWFFGPLLRRGEQHTLQHRAELLAAEIEGRPAPPPAKRSPLLPPVPFPARATALLATVAAIAALANFGGALFGQTADSVTKTFGVSNRGLGLALAVSRGGVLVSLVASALADRQGRRRLLLICFAGVGITNVISAIAPSFVVLGLAAFLTNFFSAPSAQLTNRFLTDEHGYSNTLIAVFRGVTAGLPGLIGIVIAARLAETRGRRPVAIVALAAASILQMAFFLGGGLVLWVTATFAIIAASCAAIVLVAFDTELFPTEVRGTSNALLLVCAVVGSAAGLLVATNLDDVLGGLGPAIAVCGVAPLLAAALVLPWLPEPADRTLDEVSPSEV